MLPCKTKSKRLVIITKCGSGKECRIPTRQWIVVNKGQEDGVAENYNDQNCPEKTEETGLSCFLSFDA